MQLGRIINVSECKKNNNWGLTSGDFLARKWNTSKWKFKEEKLNLSSVVAVTPLCFYVQQT